MRIINVTKNIPFNLNNNQQHKQQKGAQARQKAAHIRDGAPTLEQRTARIDRALALLTGDGEGPTDQLTRAIGLDEVSVRQSDGEVRETVISLGKQLSRRWYVGYERSLNATAGTWQLIYRIAQRFTLRAQSGEDSALDVIWTWRWH